jgi:hypothetical protein
VISVQAIVLSLESLQIRRNHNWLKSLSFFFSPALRPMQVPLLQEDAMDAKTFEAAVIGKIARRIRGRRL